MKALPLHVPVDGHDFKTDDAFGIKGKILGESFTFALVRAEKRSSPPLEVAISVTYLEKQGWLLKHAQRGGKESDTMRFPIAPEVARGSEVYVRIQSDHGSFMVFVDGAKLCDFETPVDLHSINRIDVTGDLELHRTNFEKKSFMVPYISHLTEPYHIGKSLYLSGHVEGDAKHFSVTFKVDDNNVHFTFSPRFGQRHVVRNSMSKGVWQTEERAGLFPFEVEQDFDLIIDTAQDAFHVYVNGHKCCVFYHRAPVDTIKILEITGDIQLSSLHF